MLWVWISLLCVSVQALPAVVLWHGMGDTCCQESMNSIKKEIENQLGQVFVYSIQVGQDESEDRRRGFLDNLMENQLPEVCETLKQIPELQDGFDAIGFSQGGLFLRAYVELCVPRGSPPIKTLITFGSPHAGVADVPQCRDGEDSSCTFARYLVSQGAYRPWIQKRVVQAQYYKNHKDVETYLTSSIFLPYINNEKEVNLEYAQAMKQLENLVLIKFADDDMLIPKDTAWFDFWDKDGNFIPLTEQDIYAKDTLGLKTLDQAGKLHFEELPGKHMQIDLPSFIEMLQKYLIKGQKNEEL